MQGGAALRLPGLPGLDRLLLQGPGPDEIVPEHLHRAGHRAEFVGALGARHDPVEFPVGQTPHEAGQVEQAPHDAELHDQDGRHRGNRGDEADDHGYEKVLPGATS